MPRDQRRRPGTVENEKDEGDALLSEPLAEKLWQKDVARAVLFLASDDTAAIRGTTLGSSAAITAPLRRRRPHSGLIALSSKNSGGGGGMKPSFRRSNSSEPPSTKSVLFAPESSIDELR